MFSLFLAFSFYPSCHWNWDSALSLFVYWFLCFFLVSVYLYVHVLYMYLYPFIFVQCIVREEYVLYMSYSQYSTCTRTLHSIYIIHCITVHCYIYTYILDPVCVCLIFVQQQQNIGIIIIHVLLMHVDSRDWCWRGFSFTRVH